ncbi:hypothetical protein INS49_004000 [Diaporthe citri]|uniref:uncharacterized protein n=1 Tax=Diaporthe citri TaxID=83186 RepID=UPI001C8109F8|nr:uncharacterized protein INS49_004000 [Diaporthe citri]KAG6354919.1 hypothetical protein INS49_004000 [Diaporthe citri]
MEFDEDNIGVYGALDICVRFHNNNSSFADVEFKIERHTGSVLIEGRQGEHPQFVIAGKASRVITATTENIGRLKKHIPLLDLPKIFSDALQFIKAIGISFIWIDSLCIIQDSVKDWESESRTMLQVYRHAECYLAAAVSEDSHGGLFSERDYAILPSGWFEMDNNIPRLKGTWCAVPHGYFKDAFDKQIGSSRLMSRGWVFQERAASRRVIAFGRDQVFWDCSEALESDVLPDHHINLYHYRDENNHWNSDNAMGMAVPKLLTPGVPISFYSLGDGLVAWQFIVQRYSTCDFTFNKDKPVAILCVAQMMSDALKAQPTAISTTYWAGLWLQDMYRQLAWKANLDFDPQFEHLKVSALATVAWCDNETAKDNSSFCNLSSDLKTWCNLYLLHITEPLVAVSFGAEKLYEPYVYLDYEDIGTDRLHFLPLTYNDRDPSDGNGAFTEIIVQPADNQPGVYRRCGSAELLPSEPEDTRVMPAGLSPLCHLLGESPSVVDHTYEEHDPEMGYLIRII